VYQLLSFGEPPPPPMATFAPDADSVITLGAFTKILAPGLRLGWIEAVPELCERLAGSGLRMSAGGVNPFVAELVRIAISRGLEEQYLKDLRQTLASRAACLARALRAGLPAGVRFEDPQGGYFIWLCLPDAVDTEGLLPRAHQLGVGYRAGSLFTTDGSLANCLRVGFSYYDESELQEGAGRLCELIRSA
jgi:2-aminoadipate transaminase